MPQQQTPDDFFGGTSPPPPAMPASEPTGQATPTQSPDTFFGPSGSDGGEAQDGLWSHARFWGAQILKNMGYGSDTDWGAKKNPLPPTADQFFAEDHSGFAKAANEAVIRPAISGLNTQWTNFWTDYQQQAQQNLEAYKQASEQSHEREGIESTLSSAEALYYGAGYLMSPVTAAAQYTVGQPVGAIVRKAGGSERAAQAAEDAGTAAAMLAIPGPKVQEAIGTVARARSTGVVGEGEAGFYDLKHAEDGKPAAPIAPETIQERQAATSAPEPIPQPAPPADIHQLARTIAPETLNQYDALAIERDQQKAILANATEETPEVEAARQKMLDADYAMRELSPEVMSAYHQAADIMPQEKPYVEYANPALAEAENVSQKPSKPVQQVPERTETTEPAVGSQLSRPVSEGVATEGETGTVAAEGAGQSEPVPGTPEREPRPRGNVLKPVAGTGEYRTRGLAEGVEAKAIENDLTESFGDLPAYRQISMAGQAAKASDLISKDPEYARAVAMGRRAAPTGLLPESVFVAVEKAAIAARDIETLRDLATRSSLVSEATTMGQRIRTLGERDPSSPIQAIESVRQARENVLQAKGEKVAEATEKATGEMKQAVRASRPKPQEWQDFISAITCSE